MNSNELILKLEGITKSFYGTKALDNISLDVYTSEIHAICGENGAGKSTMMNIITGSLQPNEGKIILNGEEVKMDSPKIAQEMGIGIVHQELSLCPHLSVSENIFMGRVPTDKNGFLDKAKMRKDAIVALERLDLHIDPDVLVGTLSVSKQQLVEIARVLTMNCKILILDEPTSALTDGEAEMLSRVLKQLRSEGMAMIYISHRLNEIFDLCDRFTVFRDGQYVDTGLIKDITPDDIVTLMVGRTFEQAYPAKGKPTEEVILEVTDLSRENVYKDINFKVKKGEILGMFGLVGAGRTEVVCGVSGVDEIDTGEVKLKGEKISLNSIRSVIEKGLIYITENRKTLGLFLEMSLKNNANSLVLNNISKNDFIDKTLEHDNAKQYIDDMNTKYHTIQQPVMTLSGGNQQKVLLAKSLASEPEMVILDEPTRGIDVGAKFEIHSKLRKLCNEGMGIMVVSSELPEILGLCDRVLVMYHGKIVGNLVNDNLTEEEVMMYASGRKKDN